MHEEGGDDLYAMLNDAEIDDYCRKFTDFMQAQLHRKYDLWPSRKRPRGKDQNEDSPSQGPPRPIDKGKKPLDPILLKKKES